MSMENVNPSPAIGFLIKDKPDFEDFCHRVQNVSRHHLCPFSIASSTPDYSSEVWLPLTIGSLVPVSIPLLTISSLQVDMVNEAASTGESDEEDEYVLIDHH